MVGCTVQGTINTPGTIAKAVKKDKKKGGDDEEEKKEYVEVDDAVTAQFASTKTNQNHIDEEDLATMKDFRTESLSGMNPDDVQDQINNYQNEKELINSQLKDL